MKLLPSLLPWLALNVIDPPIEWIERNINLGNDPTSAGSGFIKLDPYQKEPILAQFEKKTMEVVVMAPPQTGKSFEWRLPMIYKLVFGSGPRWVIYESDDKAEDINAQQFLPLMKSVPSLVEALDSAGRFAATKRQYKFPSGPLDFCGAGAAITSKPCKDGVADEVDSWPLTPKMKRENLRNFRDRFTTFRRKNLGCFVQVSTPQSNPSMIGEAFKRSTQEHWHLCCLKCGRRSMASWDLRNMNWESLEGEILPDTIRLRCPACGFDHEEKQAVEMNNSGGYIAKKEHSYRRGFQWGALASPRTKSWLEIAEAQFFAGKTADQEEHASLDFRYRGLPFSRRSIRRDNSEIIAKHAAPPHKKEDVICCLFSADSQDDGWFWVIRSFDKWENCQLVRHGFAKEISELEDAWNLDVFGAPCELGIIDEGGHRFKEVTDFMEENAGMYTYKGDSRIGSRWKKMREHPRRILANPKVYQAELLWLLNNHTDLAKGGFFCLPTEPDPDYMQQLCSMRPDMKKKNGQMYENWNNPTDPDHYFDCEKQIRVLFDIAREILELSDWRVTPETIKFIERKKRRKAKKQE